MVEPDPDHNAVDFRVYVSADVDWQSIPALLSCEYSEDGTDGYDVQDTKGRTAQAICQHHRESVHAGKKLYTTLFLIIDDPQPQTQGVLVVNLDPYHGYPDAVRHLPEEAGNAIASLSISNTDWYTERDSASNGNTELVPEKRFALYNMLPSAGSEDFDLALKTMNDGIQEVNSDDPPAEPVGVTKQYHVGVASAGQGLDQISAAHPAYARSHDLDPALFAVIDQDWKEKGAVFVQVHPSDDRFRCSNPTAGEILGWIFTRFMTWDDAKDFARRQ